MWALAFIPDAWLQYAIHAFFIFALGLTATGFMGSWIPFIGNYARLCKTVGIILLVVGVYFEGGYTTEMAWRHRVEELQNKVKEAEVKSQQANEDIAKLVNEKKNRTKEVQVLIQERIREVEKKIDADCKVDREAIDILNDAARNRGAKK